MAVQGGYAINHNKAIAGMLVDSQRNNTVSKLNTTSATVPYGVAVARSGENGFELITDSTVIADVVGVLRREMNRAVADGDVHGAVVDRDASVLTVGTIYVPVITTVTAGQAAYVVIGNDTDPDTVGHFSNAAGTGATTALAMPNAKFISGAASGGLAALSIVVGG
ncbi:MAG TPA: hypothetical protein ENI26_01975 [Methylophaga aminisulfidivorans]|uniref:DUF2190 family protein n=2 Tax=root TaxID=1 RepID=A0A7C1VQS7_9GAMM|nr:hypothetical protein [Methylophaga aminisulfidivorans]